MVQTEESSIRIDNATEYALSEVSLLSISFEDLEPGGTSKYKTLKSDAVEMDPILQFKVEGEQFVIYVSIPSSGAYTYSIDSLDREMQMIYLSVGKD